jgi:DNA invertase Pin-like site-specific DNA recombinase
MCPCESESNPDMELTAQLDTSTPTGRFIFTARAAMHEMSLEETKKYAG